MKFFGSSGIRATFDRELLDLALKVGLAVGSRYESVVMGRDSRTSSVAMSHALASGILAAGGECADAGLVPTPTLALAARNFTAGAMITASHNPPEYNGIKLFNPDGSAFDTGQQREIEEMVLADSATAPWQKVMSGTDYPGTIERHIARVRQDIPRELNLKVVVDAGGGAACLITPRLLRELGCEVICLNCEPTGFFPREPEPTEANLKDLMKVVREAGADIGIAHDGDGDRMVVVDERGQYLSGDRLLVILARDLGASEIVTTVDASMVIDDMGFKTSRTRVGDSFVSQALKAGARFGGEPCGAWVFPQVSLCPDVIYAAARICDIARRQKLSELAREIPQFPIIRTSISGNDIPVSRLKSLLESLGPQSVDETDGLKLNFGDGWLLVRPSGTEPLIRITVEARDNARARQLCDKTLSLIREGK
ncbi:MAG: phosphoglucosamine mutase [Chloroflexota bacterium]